MLISSLKLERKALKAFRGDKDPQCEPIEFQFKHKMETYKRIESDNDMSMAALEFEGGNKIDDMPKKKSSGGIFSCFRGSGSKRGNKQWDLMTEYERKERITYLWEQARKYTTKIRF